MAGGASASWCGRFCERLFVDIACGHIPAQSAAVVAAGGVPCGGGLYGCPEPPDTESGRAWYGGGVCRMYAPGFPVQRDGCGCYDGKRTCFGRCVFLGVLSGQNGFARRCRIRRYKDDHRSSPYLWRLRDFQLSADITRCGGTGGNRAVDLQKASRKDGLPFGPFFYLGYLATLLMGTF